MNERVKGKNFTYFYAMQHHHCATAALKMELSVVHVRHLSFMDYVRFIAIAFLIAFNLSQHAIAAEVPHVIEADASENYFYIEPSFDGMNIVLFGAVDRERFKGDNFDIAVTIRGPDKSTTVWKKAKHFGLWLNNSDFRFDNAPSFYGILATKPIRSLGSFEERAKHELGLDVLALTKQAPESLQKTNQNLSEYEEALIRVKSAEHLYFEDDASIKMLGKSLFRARTFLPASSTTGRYRIQIFLIQNGKVIGSTTSKIHLEKIGLESFLSAQSTGQPWLYGVCAVLLAAFIGSGASFMFRRQ